MLSETVCAQQNVVTNYYDSARTVVKEEFHTTKGPAPVLEGTYLSFYTNGQEKTKGYYSSNVAEGMWEYFYENGNPKMRGPLSNNQYHGVWEYFYENGHLQMTGAIYDTTRQGNWQFFYERGTLKSEGVFLNGKKDSTWQYYYEDEKLKAREKFIGDTSLYEEYYASGTLKLKGTQINGINEGRWIQYYESEKKKAEGLYKHGNRQGQWRFYHPNGKLASTGDFMDDSSVGKWTYFHENGSISAEGAEKDGLKEGYWKLYQDNGQFKGEAVFNEGEGTYKEFYEDKSLKVKGQMYNGEPQGKWQYFYEDGVLEGDAIFKNGVGSYNGYYRDGQLKMKGTIEDGKRVGVWQLYKADGTLAGYYTSVYENNETVFRALDKVNPGQDSTVHESKQATLNPEYLYRKKTSRYFKPRINELTGFIIGVDVLGIMFNQLPLSVEYYMQERLGYELEVGYQRNPFFLLTKNIPSDTAYQRGFFAAFKQKFYHKDTPSGMFYFGHQVEYGYVNHLAKITLANDATAGTQHEINRTLAHEDQVSYSILGGTRLMKDSDIINSRVTKDVRSPGITIDLFGSLGLGYRFVQKRYDGNQFDTLLGHKNSGGWFVPWQIGATIGYVF